MIRHAEAEHNVSDLANDSTSTKAALTIKGMGQAEQLAEKLKNYHFDAVLTSQLERAIDTAIVLNAVNNAPLFKDDRLNDIRTGMQIR